MEIERAFVKENNGGGLQIECYNGFGEIVSVITGIEQTDNKNGIADLIGIVDGVWDYTDASNWYDNDGNSCGDVGPDGEELTARDVADENDETNIIAEYDGKTMHIFFSDMGRAGQRYFSVS